MSDGLFWAVAGLCFLIGLPWRRWHAVTAALLLWVVGLDVAALVGAFDAASEDNALGVFFFTGIPTILWVVAFGLGAFVGLLFRRRSENSRT